MSEIIENDDSMMEENESVETTEAEAAEAESAEVESVEEAPAPEAAAEEQAVDMDDVLFDKIQRAARLLRNRKAAMAREAEEDQVRNNDLMRALKLLELKNQMEQKEMSDLLGMRLRELDVLLHQAEEAGVVARVMPEEEDMRAILVSANENAEELAAGMLGKRKKLVAQLSAVDAEDIIALMDKVIDPLVEMGLDEDRGPRGGFGGGRGGDRGPRRDDRGPRRDDRGPRGGFGGDRGGDRGPRRDDRGPRRDFDRGPRRDDRGGRGGFGGDRGGRGGYGDRGPRRDFDRGPRRDDRGGRGGRGGYGDRGGRRY